MKSKCSLILKSSIALILTFLMLFGSISTVLAATVEMAESSSNGTAVNRTVYMTQNTVSTSTVYSSYKVFYAHDSGEKESTSSSAKRGLATMTNTGKTKNGYPVYKATIQDWWDGLSYIYFQGFDSSGNWAAEKKVYDNSWKVQSNYSGKLYTGSSFTTLSYDTVSAPQIYGTVKETAWSSSPLSMTDEGNGIYSYSGVNIPNGNILYRIKYNGYYYKYGNSDGKVSADSSNPTLAVVHGTSDPSSGAFQYNAGGKNYTVYFNSRTLQTWVEAKPTNYVTHVMKRDTTSGNYTADTTYGSVERNTDSAPTVDAVLSGYDFNGWYRGTTGTSVNTSGLTKQSSSGTNNTLTIPTSSTVYHYYAFFTKSVTRHNVTFTNKPSNGTVTVNGESTSPQAVEENTNFTVLAKPDNGYTLNSMSVGGSTVTANGNDTDGYTYTGNVGTADKAVVVTFKKQSYALNYTNVSGQHTFDVKVGGSAVSSGSNVEYQKAVNVTVNGASGADYKYLINSVDGVVISELDGKGTTTATGSFSMPAQAVTLTATSNKAYKVTITQPANGTLTVKSGNTTINNGDYVASGTNLSVTLTPSSGYQLDTASPSLTKKSNGTYTGSVTVNSAATISASTKVLPQYTFTLTLSNATAKLTYTKDGVAHSNESYTGPVSVDNGTNVKVTTSTSGLYKVSEWKDGTTVMSGATDTTKTFSNISAAKNVSVTATKPDASGSIYVKLSNVGTKIYYYLYGTQTNGGFPGKLLVNGTTLGTDVTYDSATGIYCITGDGSGNELKDGAGIIFSDGTNSYQSGDLTVQLGKTYTIKSGGDGYGHAWGADIQKVGDPTENTVLKIAKKSGENTDITGVYIYGGSELFGNFESCYNNIKNNSTGIASVATLDKTSDSNYYIVTIPNVNFTSSDGKFSAVVILNGHVNNGDQTANISDKEIGYTYVIDVNKYNSSTGKFDVVVSSEDYGEVYYLAGQYSDGTPYFFGTSWSPNVNQLSKSGSVYTKSFTSNIPAGTISFKVVKDGDWDQGSWPEENQTYKINANATKVTFTFDPSTHKITVTQENSSGGDTSVWPPTDTAVTNVTGSTSTTTYKLLCANNDDFNNLTAISLDKVYSDTDNTYYWADLTNYLSYDNIHVMLSKGSAKNDASNFGSAAMVNDTGFSDGSVSSKDYYLNGTKLFSAKGAERSGFKRAEVYNKNSSMNHLGVLVRTQKGDNQYSNWIEYSFYYTANTSSPVVSDVKYVDIYAKNGTIREDYFNRFTKLADTTIEDYFYYEEVDAESGETTVYDSRSVYNTAHPDKTIEIRNNIPKGDTTYETITNVPVGAKIKISTELSPNGETFTGTSKFSDTHYLKAYSFNGMTYQLFTAADGTATTKGKKYTEEWTVRDINTARMVGNNKIEVTPIYYMQDNTNCKTFYIDGYDGEVQNKWGNMLAVYPYYEGLSAAANAFGGYPGQPMLFWGGKYQMEIPLTADGTATGAQVKGLTMHNGYWDLLHRELDTVCNTTNHCQTYDFDDFYKINKEKSDADTIIYDFKYRTTSDNYNDGDQYTNYSFAGSATKKASDYVNANGVELLKDYFGRQTDIFGNLLTASAQSAYETNGNQSNELLVVSTGYKDTYVGEYATMWAVYKSDGTFIGYIAPSMLYLNSIDRVSQYTGGTDTSAGRMSWSAFKNTYNTLKSSYTGVPVLITYDKEIWNNSKDKANRSDGKWFYSKKSDKISASIKIQYGTIGLPLESNSWIDDAFDTSKTGVNGENNIGTHTGCSAYFTNTSPNLKGKVESGSQFADSTKKFTFTAQESGAYMFAGWVRYRDGKYYEISDNANAESPMSSNDIYIARFVEAQSGSLTVQHVVEQTDVYTGTGTPSITVTVKNNGTNVSGSPYTVSDGSKIDISKWIDSHFKNYTIDISLSTDPDDGSESFMKEIVSSSGNFAASPNKWNESITAENASSANKDTQTATVAQFTVQEILDSGISNLRYVSHLSKPVYKYNYEITYHYTSRFWGEQSYKVTGTFMNDNDFSANTTGSKTTAKLTADFIQNKTPYEKNFRQLINWNYTLDNVGTALPMVNSTAVSDGVNTYKLTAQVYSSNTVNDKVRAEIFLPYEYSFNNSDGANAVGKAIYASAQDSTAISDETEVVFDDKSYEGISLETQAYKLFTYDGRVDDYISGGNDVGYNDLPLIEAAPYVWKSVEGNELQYHTAQTKSMRYYTGTSFTIDDITYYYDKLPDGVTADATHIAVTADTTAVWNGNSYAWAVLDSDKNQLYSFAENGANGQYTVSSLVDTVDGVIQNTGAKRYFSRWDIYDSNGNFIASSYARKFNYSGYSDYIIKAVYDSEEENSATYDTANGVPTISYLGDTRNQWNSDKGSASAASGDKLIHDFAISYDYFGEEIREIASSDRKIKIGMLIEQVSELDEDGSGEKIFDSTYYADKYKSGTHAYNNSAIKDYFEGKKTGAQLKNALGSSVIVNSKIGTNDSTITWGKLFSDTTGNIGNGNDGLRPIDNMNRLQWYYTFNNNNKQVDGTFSSGANANYVYRASAYIIVDEAATVSSTPVYFTLYDSAHR